MHTFAVKQNSRNSTTIDLVPAVLKLRKILVPTDFSAESEKALVYASRFATQFDAKILLMHVFHAEFYANEFAYLPTAEKQIARAVKERLTVLASREIAPGLLDQVLIRRGVPFIQIADAAKELDVDLIIVNTHGYTGLKHVLLGSTAEQIVRHSPCPVLVVRAREHEFV